MDAPKTVGGMSLEDVTKALKVRVTVTVRILMDVLLSNTARR